MPEPDEPDFRALEAALLAGGIAAANVRRMRGELADHYRDLYAEAAQSGRTGGRAAAYARRQLGSEADIAAAVLSQPELRGWMYRYPAVARVLLPVAYLTLLPAVPFAAGVQHAPLILRWSACLVLSGLFTAALLLGLQLFIHLH